MNERHPAPSRDIDALDAGAAASAFDSAELARALRESLPHFTGSLGLSADRVETGLLPELTEAIRRGDSAFGGESRRPVSWLPLNVGGQGMLAALRTEEDGKLHCAAVRPVGPGRFVFGSDNEIFGRWNSLIGAGAAGTARMIPAHGGEIIPGRLADHVERIRDNLRSGVPRPVQLDVDISMACPSACPFCFSAGYRASRRDGRFMAEPLLLRIIGEWAEQGVRVVRFDGGGDPLTHPGLLTAIRECARLDLRTAVLTAGDLLRPEQFDTFLQARTYIRVSLNAASNEVRKALHGHADGSGYGVERILSALSALADARETAYGAMARSEMPLGATSMIHPANVAETVAIARRAKDAGLDHVSFRVVLGKEHRLRFSDRDRAALAEAFDDLHRDVESPSFRIFTPTRDITDQGYVPSRYFDRCRASTHRALVEVGPSPHRAAVVPCGRYRGHGYRAGPEPGRVVFGYLDGRGSVPRMWMGPEMSRLLATFPQSCGDCIDRSANNFLAGVEDILAADRSAVFHPFWAETPSGGR